MTTTSEAARDTTPPTALDVDSAVADRYSQAAQQAEAALCCPVDYDARYLEVVPPEIIERDYGCGDPSKYVGEGDVVLDLGSGGGKICYIASQVVGPNGRVIGVDANDEMLALARKHQRSVGDAIGHHNVEFHKGRIQDLALDLDRLGEHLADNPARTSGDWLELQSVADEMRRESPMIVDESVDVIVSNCVLNLVREQDRRQLFSEMHRVLRRGGRAVISDIVCDEDVPEELRNDATLWSGCLSGAHREDRFLEAFEHAGFYGLEVVARQAEPWAVVRGIEFRSLTVRAWKGKEGPCLDHHQAVVYNGPWKSVVDDDGHRLERGKRMAVCEKTFGIYSRAPYADSMTFLEPTVPVPADEARPMSCHGSAYRPAAVSKAAFSKAAVSKAAADEGLTIMPADDCCSDGSCC